MRVFYNRSQGAADIIRLDLGDEVEEHADHLVRLRGDGLVNQSDLLLCLRLELRLLSRRALSVLHEEVEVRVRKGREGGRARGEGQMRKREGERGREEGREGGVKERDERREGGKKGEGDGRVQRRGTS